MLSSACAKALQSCDGVYPVAAIGGCACPANTGVLPMLMPMNGNNFQSRVPQDHRWYADCKVDLCVCDEIASETLAVPAGETVTVTLQPDRGCFLITYAKIFTLDPATGEFLNMAIGPFNVSDCRAGCRTNPIPSRAYVTEDCLGCPLCVLIGRANEGEALTFTVTNNTLTPGEVTIVGRGRCLPGFSCLSNCPSHLTSSVAA